MEESPDHCELVPGCGVTKSLDISRYAFFPGRYAFLLDQDDKKKHVVRALKRNGYPHGVMSRSETRSNRQTQSDDGSPNATVVLPYIRNTSESVWRVLSTVNIRTCFKPYRTLSQSLVHVSAGLMPIPVPDLCTLEC